MKIAFAFSSEILTDSQVSGIVSYDLHSRDDLAAAIV